MTQDAMSSRMPELPVVHLAHLVETGTWFAIGGVVGGAVLALLIRLRGWSWTCALPLLVAAPDTSLLSWRAELCADAFAVGAVAIGAWRHVADLRAGGDLAQRARDRAGPMAPIRRWFGWRKLRNGEWVTSQGVAIGFTPKGELVRVPVASWRAVMSLLLGATGSGKTILQVLLALAAIKRGFGVIYIDPKGDDFVQEELRAAAARAGRPFRPWDPQGNIIYNPYDRGTNTEIADKLLAAEVFTEPHYQRLAQRYIGHVVRALRLAGVPVSLATVVEHMHTGRLASLTRKMTPTDARPLLAYLETLTAQQERDLAGARDRLAILAESDVGHLLDPATGGVQIDLRESLDRGDVVLFRLEADRRPLAAEMLGAAIVQDLVAISQERQQGEHRPALVIIDEFSAFGAPQTQRLFGRGRGAWLSQLLGTQEVADLGPNDTNARGGGDGILAQVVGNIEVLLCGRQNMPASAELVAAIAGTRGAWITTQQTHAPAAGLLTGLGSRSRGREYVVHPDTIKSLDVGEFVVIEPRRGRAVIVRVFHPDELRRHGVEC
jgi:type IV secretory pathway TraG/TraD family ATPase VirD4